MASDSVDLVPLRPLPPMRTVEALRRLASCRDDEAWCAILVNHGPAILRVAERIGGAARADDVCQETLLQIRTHAGQFSAPPGARDAEGAARGWVMSIAYRTALGMLRLDKRRGENEHRAGLRREPETGGPDEILLMNEQFELLRREVAELPEVLRGAVCLHYYGELSYSDVSSTLACTEEAARKRVERGVSELRARLACAGVAVGVGALTRALAGSTGLEGGAAGASAVMAFKQFGAWQALLHSSHAPALAGIVKLGGLALMGKYIVGTAAILALTLSGVQTYRMNGLASEVSALREQSEASAALQQKVGALEKQLAETQGDAAALKANLGIRNDEIAQLETRLKSMELSNGGLAARTPNAELDARRMLAEIHALQADPKGLNAFDRAQIAEQDARAAAEAKRQAQDAQLQALKQYDRALTEQQRVVERQRTLADLAKAQAEKARAGQTDLRQMVLEEQRAVDDAIRARDEAMEMRKRLELDLRENPKAPQNKAVTPPAPPKGEILPNDF